MDWLQIWSGNNLNKLTGPPGTSYKIMQEHAQLKSNGTIQGNSHRADQTLYFPKY